MEVVLQLRDFIEELNREQLRSGERSDGSMMPPYSPRSKSKNAPGPIQLFDTGLFYSGIETAVDGDGIELIGTDSKTRKLKGKYGEMILGLNDESLIILKKEMIPLIILRLRKLI